MFGYGASISEAATILGVIVLAGASMGRLLTALFTDYVFRDEAALGYSLVAVSLAGNGFALWLIRRAFRTRTTAVQTPVDSMA